MASRFIYKPYTTNSKVDCPHCGKRKCFTKVVDTETGEEMSTDFGKCDKKNYCDYFRWPTSDSKREARSMPAISEIPQVFVDKMLVKGTFTWHDKNEFCLSLKSHFGDKANEAIERYFIGTNKALHTIFWCINHDGMVWNAQMVKYNGLSRDKSSQPYWYGTRDKGYEACLFGMHLIKPKAKVKIVEAPKTAVIASIAYPEFTWLATAGANGLTPKKCEHLKKAGVTDVTLFPDADKAGRDAVARQQENLGIYEITSKVHDLGSDAPDGQDLADLILEKILQNKYGKNNRIAFP